MSIFRNCCILYEGVYDARGLFVFLGGAEVSFLYGLMFGWGLMGVLKSFFAWGPALYPVMFDVVLTVMGGFLILLSINKK